MKIIDGIRLKGRPAEIPDCSRDDLPEFFKEMGFKVGVEIGVFRADYTEVLAKSGLQIYGVDPWQSYRDYGNENKQKWLDDRYEVSKKRMAKYPNVTLLRETSMEAVAKFKEGSIDFVYIDGNHYFKYVAEDIYEWSRIVKKGGILSGHDYASFKHRYVGGGCQAKEVVDAFAEAYDAKNFWILGRRRADTGEKRDNYRSWMMFNDFGRK